MVVPSLAVQGLGLSSRCGDSASEPKRSQRWQHQRERVVDDEAGEPLTRPQASVLAPRSAVRHRGSREGLIETRIYDPTVLQGVLVDGFRLVERFGSLRGDGATWVAGASGASALSVLCRSDSAGYGLRARDCELRGFEPLRRQRWRGHVWEIRSFLQTTLGSLARIVG
jgi:hypothetical protein